MNTLRRYTINHIPFLRLLIPLIIGIVWQHWYTSDIIIYVWCGIVVCSGIVAWVTRHNHAGNGHRYAFTLCTSAIIIVTSMVCYRCNTAQYTLPDIGENTVAIARIKNVPTEKEYSYSTQAVVVALYDSGTIHKSHLPLLLHFKKSHTSSHLTGGDIIIFKPNPQRIESSVLPYAYDYAHQMALKGLVYRQYLNDNEWVLSKYTTSLSLQDYAQKIQSQCINTLYECELSADNSSLMAGILWGYREDISDTQREYFSAAGMSHVLAVSGLHTGIIAFILWLLLYPLRYTRLRKMQYPIVILTLWLYAFVTGLSPSVTRACIMATFIGVAHLINRRNTTLNALCGSAVIVLLIAPMQLFDIGFQLSYAAVAGIVLLSPYLDISRHIESSNAILRYISGIISVSLAAQLATLPLAAYYFHYIPVWGLLSNILLVPLLPVLVIMTFLLQLLHVSHITHTWLSDMTNSMANLFTQGAFSIAHLPSSTIDGVWITLPILLSYIVIIVSVWYMFSRKTLKPVIIPLLAIVIIQVLSIVETLTPSTPYAFVPREREYTNLQLSNHHHNCYIITTAPDTIPPRNGKEWRIREHLNTRFITPNDTINNDSIYIALPFIEYYGTRILWVDNNTWRYCNSNELFTIDYAIITEKYNGRIAHLLNNFDIDNIVLSASIFPLRAQSLQIECVEKGITYYNIRTENTIEINVLRKLSATTTN